MSWISSCVIVAVYEHSDPELLLDLCGAIYLARAILCRGATITSNLLHRSCFKSNTISYACIWTAIVLSKTMQTQLSNSPAGLMVPLLLGLSCLGANASPRHARLPDPLAPGLWIESVLYLNACSLSLSELWIYPAPIVVAPPAFILALQAFARNLGCLTWSMHAYSH